jgi:very-short-patch-repair endonuclease
VIVEVDGFAFHNTRAAFERDRASDRALQAAGYVVLRITWRQLVDEPEAVIAAVATALAQRRSASSVMTAS